MKNRKKIIKMLKKIKTETRRRRIEWKECDTMEFEEIETDDQELIHHYRGKTNGDVIFHLLCLANSSQDVWKLYIEKQIPEMWLPPELYYSTADSRSSSLAQASKKLASEIIACINDVPMTLSMHDTVDRYLSEEVIAYD